MTRTLWSINLALFLALLSGAEASWPETGKPEAPAPSLPPSSQLLSNLAYQASFNREHKQSDWVFYGLGPAELRNCVNRSGSFRADPRLTKGQGPEPADYSGSGFDRGHLTPAADNRWTETAMKESFLLTNVSPQRARFNGGIWARLEALVRAWALESRGLWVATGPLLKKGLAEIGDNVTVPEYFYKALAAKDGSRAIAFVLPVDASGELSRYELTIDQLENISGLDFLKGMRGEEELEQQNDAAAWNLRAKFAALPCSASVPTMMEWSWGIAP